MTPNQHINEAQARYESALASLMIELAFLLPRDSDARTHPFCIKLEEVLKSQRNLTEALTLRRLA